MSYTKTAEIPRDHPLALLIERSKRANELPSCGGCKFWGLMPFQNWNYRLCSGHGTVANPADAQIYTLPKHGCLAWEAKA